MSDSYNDLVEHADHWIKLNIAVDVHLKAALLDILHNIHNDPSYDGLPKNPALLLSHMIQFKRTKEGALRHVLHSSQWDIICPPDGRYPDTTAWDVTILIAVIINVLRIPPPQGGWKRNMPMAGDTSRGAIILLARWLRNRAKHSSVQEMQPSAQFDPLWEMLMQILDNLNYDQEKMEEVEELGEGSLTKYTPETVNFLEDTQANLKQQVEEMGSSKEKSDVSNIQAQLDNLEVALKSVKSNFPEEKQEHLSVSVSQLASMFVESANVLNARLKRLEQQPVDIELISEGAILDEVFHIVIEMLTRSEWEQMLNTLQLSFKEKIAVFLSSRSIDTLRCRDLSWFELKHRLIQVERADVVKRITSETFITTGFKSAMMQHKENLRQSYMSKRFVKPFLGASGETELDDKNFAEAFVELAIIKGKSVDEKYLNSSRDYHLQQVILEKEYIRLEDLVREEDRFVIISGVPGIGKSTLVKKLILEWEQGTVLNGCDGSPNVRLLFPILCRELNTMVACDETTADEILQQLFPSFFTDGKMLSEVNEHILFLLDGVDELKFIDSITSSKRPPFVNLLYHLMNPKFLGQHRCVLIGRPRITRVLRSFFRKTFEYDSKKVEVCGFSKTNVEAYVTKQFTDNVQLGKDIFQKIRSSPITDGLSRIPLYAWVLTSIYKDNPFMEVPLTATELLVYSFLVFIRRQKEKNGLLDDHWSLKKLTEDPDVIKHILTLAEHSYETLLKSEIIFQADESPALHAIEDIGLLVKSTHRETGVTTYQFQHLTFQELFAAVHILRMPELKADIVEESILQACLTIVAGLEGIAYGETKSNRLLTEFLERLLLQSADKSMRVTGMLQDKWSKSWQQMDGDSNVSNVNISDLFIEAFFENQSPLFPNLFKLPPDTVIRYEKQPGALPLTQYPLYRLYYFTHSLLAQLPSLRIAFLPLFGTAFGMIKIGQILLRCQSIYLNSKYIYKDDLQSLFSFIYERLYTLEHFKEITINLHFTEMNFLLDHFTSLFRTKFVHSLYVSSVEIHHKPKLAWSKILAQLHWSIEANLRKLTLSRCCLTDDILKDSIGVFEGLTHLDLSYNDLSQLTLVRLLNSGTPTSPLVKLDFRWNQFRKLLKRDRQEIIGLNTTSLTMVLAVLDISECGNNEVYEGLYLNIVRHVRHLKADRYTRLNEYLQTLRGTKYNELLETRLDRISIASEYNSEHVVVLDPLHVEEFGELDVALDCSHGDGLESEERLPNWFDFRMES